MLCPFLVPGLVEPGALCPALGLGLLEVGDELGAVDLRDAVARLVRVGPGVADGAVVDLACARTDVVVLVHVIPELVHLSGRDS